MYKFNPSLKSTFVITVKELPLTKTFLKIQCVFSGVTREYRPPLERGWPPVTVDTLPQTKKNAYYLLNNTRLMVNNSLSTLCVMAQVKIRGVVRTTLFSQLLR